MPECPNSGAMLDKEIKFSFSKLIAVFEEIGNNVYCCNDSIC